MALGLCRRGGGGLDADVDLYQGEQRRRAIVSKTRAFYERWARIRTGMQEHANPLRGRKPEVERKPAPPRKRVIEDQQLAMWQFANSSSGMEVAGHVVPTAWKQQPGAPGLDGKITEVI
jgi:hypothetical protein